ncbi:MAG: hypothetical protein M3332_08510 [Actinomycetota bacterium]|nr:hypothetical protein [Actinomycetota bacterium]
MFDTFFGLPTHAIIVHAVVIFVPLTAVAAIALTAVPRWRTRFGVLAGLAALTSIGSVFVAQESGEILEDRVLSTENAPFELVLEHSALGDDLLPWVLLLSIALLVLIGLAFWGTRRGADGPSWLNLAGWGIGAVSVVGAVLSTIYVVLIGHSGSAAVWSNLPS